MDYNLFSPNQTLVPGTFWVLEQLPGIVKMSDMSAHLENERYWASYNLPLVSFVTFILRPRLHKSEQIVARTKTCTVPPCVYTGPAELDEFLNG